MALDSGYKIAVPTTELQPLITIAIIEDPDGKIGSSC